MPLHSTGLTSRYALDHPDEKPPVQLEFERVLKWNESQHPRDKSGQFASGGGGGGGDVPPHLKGMNVDVSIMTQRPPTPKAPHLKGMDVDVSIMTQRPAPPPPTVPPHLKGMNVDVSIMTQRPSATPQGPAREKIRQDAQAHLKGMSVDIASPEYRGVGTPAHLRGMRVDVASPAYRGVGQKPSTEPVTSFFKDLRKSRHTGSMHSSGKPKKRSTFS